MLNHQDALLDLVGTVHLAAVDATNEEWPRALARVSDALGGAGAIIADHRLPNSIVDLTCARVAPEVSDYILGRLQGTANPLVEYLPQLPQQMLLSMEQLANISDPVHLEGLAILRGVGVGHVSAAVLERSHGHALTMSVLRSPTQGVLTSGDKDLLATLLPHLATAALVRRRLAHALASANAPRAFLDVLERGVLLVDAAAKVAYANMVASRILARRCGLSLDRGGTLVAARPPDTGRLRKAIADAASAGKGSGLELPGTLVLPRSVGRPFILQVLPLPPEPSLPGLPHLSFRPEAAVMLGDPDMDFVPSERQLQQTYGLTPAEAAITARVATGMSLRDAAKELQISENTAKAQLKLVYSKVEVDRQSALVRRLFSDLGSYAGSWVTTV